MLESLRTGTRVVRRVPVSDGATIRSWRRLQVSAACVRRDVDTGVHPAVGRVVVKDNRAAGLENLALSSEGRATTAELVVAR